MILLRVLALAILLGGCDGAEDGFPDPPDRILSLESPSSRDTLEINRPFLLKGTLDIDAAVIRLQVISQSIVFFDQEIQNPQGLQPIMLDSEYTINTPTGSNTAIEVGLRLSWNEGNAFAEVPMYLK